MADFQFPDSRIILFAKAPLEGQVKTRMQPTLTLQQSLTLHRNMLSHSLQQACQSHLAPVELWVTAEHGFWQSLRQRYEFSLHIQTGEDLGRRMLHAATATLQSAAAVVIMGADCPAIDGNYLRAALTLLHAGEPAVLGPASDGGYVLIGITAVDDSLFIGLPWGTQWVLEQTRARLEALGLSWTELEVLADIDRPEDIQYLPASLRL